MRTSNSLLSSFLQELNLATLEKTYWHKVRKKVSPILPIIKKQSKQKKKKKEKLKQKQLNKHNNIL